MTVAPSGATFLSGPQWKGWDGALVVACLDGSQRMLIMKLNSAGTALTQAPTGVLTFSVRLRAAVEGPDGNLYVVTDGLSGAGAIWKLKPLSLVDSERSVACWRERSRPGAGRAPRSRAGADRRHGRAPHG